MPESEARKAYKKKWKEEHKEHVQQQSKQYYLDNRDKKLSYCKAYREANLDNIKEKASQLVVCDRCGEHVQRKQLSTHQKTNKCTSFTNKEFKKDSVYCPLCDSIVCDKYLTKHQTTEKCKKRAELKAKKNESI